MIIKDLLLAQTILQRLNNEKMPVKLAYAMAKNFRLVNQELEDFEKARKKMLEDNFDYNEKEGKFNIPPERQKEAQEMFEGLIQMPVNVNFYPIKMELLEQLELTPADAMALDWLIQESE